MGGESSDKLNPSRFSFTSDGRFEFTEGARCFMMRLKQKSHDHRGCFIHNVTHIHFLWSIKQSFFTLMAHSQRGFVLSLFIPDVMDLMLLQIQDCGSESHSHNHILCDRRESFRLLLPPHSVLLTFSSPGWDKPGRSSNTLLLFSP